MGSTIYYLLLAFDMSDGLREQVLSSLHVYVNSDSSAVICRLDLHFYTVICMFTVHQVADVVPWFGY